MDILKLSMEWAKDEILSSKFFILFGLLFLFGALGFWQMGKTELAKAFINPLLVCGTLLFIIGVGLLYSNTTRIHSFEKKITKRVQRILFQQKLQEQIKP